MHAGLVSVIIPAYNAAWCVAKAIDSALAQTYALTEVLVVDDGSTDETATVVEAYGARVRLLRQANGGLSSARNLGIRNARGEYVAFLDADDYWLPAKLERQINLMRAHSDVGFCSTATRVETPQGEHLGLWECPAASGEMLRAIFAVNGAIAGSGSSVVVRSDVLARAGEFDTELQSLEDIDMWMRLAALSSYACIDEPLSVILKRPDSMSRNLDKMRASALRVMRKNRHLLPPQARGGFWRYAYAGVLADYAKWEYRTGRRPQALMHLLQGMLHSPLRRGRLIGGLLLGALTGRLA